MFKKKFLGLLLGLSAVVLLPSVALAQTSGNEMLYEDTSVDWEYESDYDEFEYSIDGAERAAATYTAIMALLLIPAIIVGVVTYIYTGITVSKIGKKLNYEKTWYAWVPVLNFVMLLELADMNPLLIFLGLIPVVNGIAGIVLTVMTMMKICEKLGMDKYLGLLALVPLANYLLLGILAWKKEDGQAQTTQQPVQQESQQTPNTPTEA